MLEFLGVFQFFVISFVCLFELKRKSPTVFLWGTVFLMFGLMHLLNSIVGDYEYPSIILMKASVFVICFSSLYLFTRLFSRASLDAYIFKNDTIIHNLNNETNFKYNILFLIFLLALFIDLYVIIKYSGGFLYTSWGAGREYSSSVSYLNVNQLTGVIYFLLSGLSIIFFVKRSFLKSFIMVLAFIISVVVSRNRIEILPVFIFFFFVYLYNVKNINIIQLILIVIFAFIVVYIVYALRVFRHAGTITAFIENFSFEFFLKINRYLAENNGELALLRDFYYFIMNDNNFENFGKGHSYIRMLLVYIPTKFSMGIKPPDFAQSMGAAIGMGAGGSTHPTLFGDCFANFGWYGVFLGIYWGIFANLIDYLICSRKYIFDALLLYSLSSISYCIIGRGSIYNGFIPLAWGSLIIFFGRYLNDFLVKLSSGNIELEKTNFIK